MFRYGVDYCWGGGWEVLGGFVEKGGAEAEEGGGDGGDFFGML